MLLSWLVLWIRDELGWFRSSDSGVDVVCEGVRGTIGECGLSGVRGVTPHGIVCSGGGPEPPVEQKSGA